MTKGKPLTYMSISLSAKNASLSVLFKPIFSMLHHLICLSTLDIQYKMCSSVFSGVHPVKLNHTHQLSPEPLWISTFILFRLTVLTLFIVNFLPSLEWCAWLKHNFILFSLTYLNLLLEVYICFDWYLF